MEPAAVGSAVIEEENAANGASNKIEHSAADGTPVAIGEKKMEKALAVQSEIGSLGLQGAKVDGVSLTLNEDITWDRWEDIGGYLGLIARNNLWWIADWLAAGERKWGEMYVQAIHVTGLSESRLQTIQSVGSRFQSCRRRQDLSFGHHEEVASLKFSEEDQGRFLAWVEAHQINRGDLRKAVNRWKRAKEAGQSCVEEFLSDLLPGDLTEPGLFPGPEKKADKPSPAPESAVKAGHRTSKQSHRTDEAEKKQEEASAVRSDMQRALVCRDDHFNEEERHRFRNLVASFGADVTFLDDTPDLPESQDGSGKAVLDLVEDKIPVATGKQVMKETL